MWKMQRFKCRVCFKTFVNGRALGGHMRSHNSNLSAKREEYEEEEEEEEEERPSQLSEETESGSLLPSSSFSSEEDGNAGECYGLRENLTKNIPVGDPEFAFAVVDPDSGVVVGPQDGESESESSRVNSTRKRSKRTRKLSGLDSSHHRELSNVKKLKTSQLGCKAESGTEPEPLSSVSNATTEEDLAVCLMMLSRDRWKTKTKITRELEEDDYESSEDYRSSKNIGKRSKYKCETCKKVFKSFQALGGHRASHKKNRVSEFRTEHDNGVAVSEKKTHECPICLRVFSSGQALGGHKRSHGIDSLQENHVFRMDNLEVSCVKVKQRLIDLNLPATAEEDETSHVEVSVVFDENEC